MKNRHLNVSLSAIFQSNSWIWVFDLPLMTGARKINDDSNFFSKNITTPNICDRSKKKKKIKSMVIMVFAYKKKESFSPLLA